MLAGARLAACARDEERLLAGALGVEPRDEEADCFAGEARQVPEVVDQLLDLVVQAVDVAAPFHAESETVLVPASLRLESPPWNAGLAA